jgi:carbonic anhydrase/acetyltransferase-like protein (isoleucine patch superfamily)
MILKYKDKYPEIAETSFVAEDADIIGDVKIGMNSSIWFKTVVRGDVNFIVIGENTNIQDNSVLHVTTDTHPLIIGNDVTAGHGVILHGCTIKDRVLIGMGSIVLDGAVIDSDTLVAAGSVVTQNTRIPSGKLVMGTPARIKRDLTDEEIHSIKQSSVNYVKNSEHYRLNK